MKKYKLGIIGMGNMASAIVSGVINSFFLNNKDICFYEIDNEKSRKSELTLKIDLCKDIEEVLLMSEYVLLAFKPQNLKDNAEILTRYFDSDKNILVSILAGIPIKYFEGLLSKKAKIIRIMPNAPVLINKGISAVSVNTNINSVHKDFVIKLFGCIGSTVIIDEEYQNLAIALSGSSPAYFYLICKYMTEYAIERGLDEKTARNLVAGSMIGSGEMINNSSEDINEMIKKVASKGGTTERAIESFEKNDLKKIINDAMDMALKRAYEIEDSI